MTKQDIARVAAGLTIGEVDRLTYGRLDWRAGSWQDHCGDPSCDLCTGLIPDAEPHRLPDADKALRDHILREKSGG